MSRGQARTKVLLLVLPVLFILGMTGCATVYQSKQMESYRSQMEPCLQMAVNKEKLDQFFAAVSVLSPDAVFMMGGSPAYKARPKSEKAKNSDIRQQPRS